MTDTYFIYLTIVFLIFSAIFIKAFDWGLSGLDSTIGFPVSPPALISASIGISPNNCVSCFSHSFATPPCEKISVLLPQSGQTN